MAEFDREGARKAGYSDAEIDGYLAEQNKPRVSQGLIDRIQNTNTANDIAKSMWEGAKEGFGSNPIGIEPGSEQEKLMMDAGWLNDPSTGRVGPLRTLNEAIIRPAAALGDTIMRLGNAGIFAGAGLIGQAAKDSGAANDAEANRLKRDAVIFGQIAPILHGTSGTLHRVTRDPMGRMIDEPVGGLPNAQDFADAAKVATEGQADAHVKARLEDMYEKKGILPAEAVADANRDPIAKQDLLMRDGAASLDAEINRLDAETIKSYGGYNRHSDDPLERALATASSPAGLDHESIANAQWAVDNGRADITRVIAGRARRYADQYETTPGVTKELNPEKYATIEQDLKRRKAEAEDLATKLEDVAKSARSGPVSTGGGGKPPGKPPGGGKQVGEPEEPRNPKAGEDVKAAEDKVLSQLSVGEPDRPASKMDPYTATVDSLFPIKKEVEKAKGKGLDISISDDPYIASRLYGGWVGKAQVALEHEGPFNFFTYENLGPSLKAIIAPVRDQISSWRAFLASARAVELERFKHLPSGIDQEAAQTVGRNAPQIYKDQAAKIYEYQNQVSAYARDAQVISRAGYKGMLDMNRFYVPWHKLLDEEGIGISPIGTSLQAKNPINRIKGHEEKTIDPIESVIKNTYIMTAMAEKNVVGTKLVDMMIAADKIRGELKPSERAIVKVETAVPKEVDVAIRSYLREHGASREVSGFSDFVVEAAQPLAEDEIRIFRNGQPEHYKVSVELARAMKGLDRGDIGLIERILQPLASTLRAGAVLSPEFAARHLIRDTTYAFMTWAHEGNFGPLDTATGLKNLAVGHSELVRGMAERIGDAVGHQDFVNWLKGGGGQVGLVAMDRRYLQQSLRELTGQTGLMERGWNVARQPDMGPIRLAANVAAQPFQKYLLEPLQAVTEMATSATHMGAFSKRMRQLENEGRIAPGYGKQIASKGEYDAPRLGYLNPENLPAEWRGKDLRIRDGLFTKDGMKAFDYVDGEYKDVLTRDQPSKQAIIEAAWTARDTSVDMHRMGAKMRGFNMVSVFANAKIQDTFRIVDLIKKDPANAAMMITAGIVMPSVLFWLLNHKDSRYQQLQAWEKDSFWIIPTDKWENANPEQAANRPSDQIRMLGGQLQVNNGAIIRIAKPFNAGVLFGSGMERLLEKFAAENPHAFDGWTKSILENTVGDLVPSAVVPAMEQANNNSRLSGRKVIPGNLEGQMPEYQYTPYTTEIAKKLGMLVSSFPGMHKATQSDIGAVAGTARALSSPMLIENYVRGWTGTLGVYALHAADSALQKAGVVPSPVKPLATLADIPFIRAFVVRYPTAGVEPVERFFSAVAENKVLHDTFMRRAQQGDVDAMQRIQAIGGPQMFERLERFKKAITRHSDLINKVYENPKIDPAQKRQLIDNYYFAMIRMGKIGSDMVENIDRGLRSPAP
jgi:hypothetical protein